MGFTGTTKPAWLFVDRSEVTLDDPTAVAQDGSTSMEPTQLLGRITDLTVMRGGGKNRIHLEDHSS